MWAVSETTKPELPGLAREETPIIQAMGKRFFAGRPWVTLVLWCRQGRMHLKGCRTSPSDCCLAFDGQVCDVKRSMHLPRKWSGQELFPCVREFPTCSTVSELGTWVHRNLGLISFDKYVPHFPVMHHHHLRSKRINSTEASQLNVFVNAGTHISKVPQGRRPPVR